jgi:type II secretory ATPase GspE/PulE/Tfp pilus assembly ATPase PilB-like protein
LPAHIDKPNLENLQLFHPGISTDNPFGYSGQFAVRELLLMTPALQQELRRPAHEITTSNLQKIAVSDGMLTILQYGILRAISGETSLEEIIRVVDY